MKLSVKQMLVEFKDFAFKGNMIDLAVGVVIGTAFGTVIQSVVKNVVMPLVGMVPGLRGGYEKWHFGDVKVGLVLADLLNFTMVALAVFVVIVKLVGGIVKTTNRKSAEPSAPTTKECPHCLSAIPIKATKCAHCTAELSGTVTG
jgi:large conductance mechanosensitive channel